LAVRKLAGCPTRKSGVLDFDDYNRRGKPVAPIAHQRATSNRVMLVKHRLDALSKQDAGD
jgi:hypothetical protein